MKILKEEKEGNASQAIFKEIITQNVSESDFKSKVHLSTKRRNMSKPIPKHTATKVQNIKDKDNQKVSRDKSWFSHRGMEIHL